MDEVIVLLFWLTLPAVFIIFRYNSLIRTKNQVDNAFGSIDVMLKKRYDLLPNLIEIVKGYMQHEKELLIRITELRTQFMSDTSSDDKVELDKKIRTALGEINLTVENHPELKSGENFLQIQKAWNETEEQISASRRFFNTAVTEYNNKIEQFPSNLIARIMKYKRKLLFETTDEVRRNVNVNELF